MLHPSQTRALPPADIDRPSTWSRYKSSMCDTCQAGCCSLPVEVTTEDLLRLELIDEDEALMGPKKIASKLSKEGYVQSFRSKTGLFTLAQKPNRSCLFLNERSRCTVYEKRPIVCRRFPEVGPRPQFCPYMPVKKK